MLPCEEFDSPEHDPLGLSMGTDESHYAKPHDEEEQTEQNNVEWCNHKKKQLFGGAPGEQDGQPLTFSYGLQRARSAIRSPARCCR